MEKVHHGLPAFGIVDGGHGVPGFVEREVELVFGRSEEASIDFDVILIEIGLAAELRDDIAVDRDAAFEHDLLSLTPGSDAGLREDLLEALFGH
jgi:hypothetical protein